MTEKNTIFQFLANNNIEFEWDARDSELRIITKPLPSDIVIKIFSLLKNASLITRKGYHFVFRF